MDSLSPLFTRFSLSVRVFYSGTLCDDVNFKASPGFGHLHVLRQGGLQVTQKGIPAKEISEPSVLFYPRSYAHRFKILEPSGAKLVCASIDFGESMGNPILQSLPDCLLVPLAGIAGIDATLTLLFDEAFADFSGRQAAIDRLMEYLFLLLLRHVIDADLVEAGMLAALTDPRLTKAVAAMHEHPEYAWSLEELGGVAGMSRARFAAHFRKVTGWTPLDYLTDWRVSVAQTLLKKGKAMKLIAPMVGYSSPVAFARVFANRVGMTPAEWLKR